MKKLQTLPAIQNFAVVALSNPVKETELADVRKLFLGVGSDVSCITDEELSLFINSKLLGQFGYYIDYDLRRKRRKPIKIRIKRIEEHPLFSPALEKKDGQY